MLKNSENARIKYFQEHDFGDEIREGLENGHAWLGHGETMESILAKVRAHKKAITEKAESQNSRKMASFRIPEGVIAGLKRNAARAGMRYQTYVNHILAEAAK